jgi:hypothetical protein
MTAAQRQQRHRLGLTNGAKQGVQRMAEEATQLRPTAPPLPATRADLLAGYKLKRKRSINDLVEEVIVRLWDQNEEFMKYVDAIYDSDAIEGSLEEDDTMAAQIIRNVAKKENLTEVAAKNLHTIKLAMRVGLRRFGVARPEREEQAQLQLASQQPPMPQSAQ